jgi:hypothetical protein
MIERRPFDLFVMLAEMRTGSNILEANINEFPSLRCEGEVFNPAFIAHQGGAELFGITLQDRALNPISLLDALRTRPVLSGFRFFHDHDPRILPTILEDPRCAKIILTRNPVDSYVSLKIAQETQQWKLGDVKTRRTARVTFDPIEFENHALALQGFQLHVVNTLQRNAQTAFYINYDDVNDVDVLNGLARWLGVREHIEAPSARLKRQNPEPLSEKLMNFDAVADGLARLDRFDLTRTPGFEPRRAGQMSRHLACPNLPLVHAPLLIGADEDVTAWLRQVADGQELLRDFTPASWREWQARNPRRVAFGILHHPLERAHHVFRTQVVHGPQENVRRWIARTEGIEFVPGALPDEFGRAEHHAAFAAYLRFVIANLNGQTGMVQSALWASQSNLLEAITRHCPLNHLVHKAELGALVPLMAQALGVELPEFSPAPKVNRLMLSQIHDDDIAALGRAAYGVDYLRFGFDDWAG